MVNEAVPVDPYHNDEEVDIWKKYDDGYIVRSMRPCEVKIMLDWFGDYISAKHDVNICLEIFPKGPGFYVGEFEGKVVASSIRIPWGNSTYYGSNYYVAKEYRSKGFATRLRDQVAFGHVGKNVLCIDAVVGTVSRKNIEKFSYEQRFETASYEGTAKDNYNINYQGTILPASDVEFSDIIRYDNKCFISKINPQRTEILRRFIELKDSSSYVALDENNIIIGCAYQRPAHQEGHAVVGPLYADSLDIAKGLLQRLAKDVSGKELFVNICQPNKSAMKLVEDFGMKKTCEFNRMHANGDAKELKDEVYFFTSVEICGF